MYEKHGSHIYKYNYLISSLRKKIFDEEFAPNGKLPPERELSSLYNLSRVTVRSALRQLEQEGLIERRRGCGTMLKQRTAMLEKSESRTLKVLYIGMDHGFSIEENPFFGQIFLGFHRASMPGVTFEVESCFVPDDFKLKEMIRRISTFDCCLVNYPASEEDLTCLENNNIRYLCMGHPEGNRTVPKVDIDNFQGTFVATEHLLEKGYRRIALLHHNYAKPLQEASVSGYRLACQQYGVEVDPELIHEIVPYDSVSSEDCLEKLIADKIKFDAVLVMGDWATFGAMNALKRHKYKVPGEVGLLSYDAYPWLLNGLKPRPTNVMLPFAKMAEKALLMLGAMEREIPGVVMQALIIPELHQGQTT